MKFWFFSTANAFCVLTKEALLVGFPRFLPEATRCWLLRLDERPSLQEQASSGVRLWWRPRLPTGHPAVSALAASSHPAWPSARPVCSEGRAADGLVVLPLDVCPGTAVTKDHKLGT